MKDLCNHVILKVKVLGASYNSKLLLSSRARHFVPMGAQVPG